MKMHAGIKKCAIAVAVAATVCLNAGAAITNLVSEDFQTPLLSNGTGNPAFSGWTWENAPAVKSRRVDSQSDVPGDMAITNQVIQFEWTSAKANYDVDVSHTWALAKAYTLTLNASPQSWHGADDRYIASSLLQQDGTVLWSDSVMMPKYDNFGRNPWTAAQTFSFLILTDNFTTGTPGQPIRLKIEHTAARGIYVDNVELTVDDPPVDTNPPSPDPMTWLIEPTLHDSDIITMTATNAKNRKRQSFSSFVGAGFLTVVPTGDPCLSVATRSSGWASPARGSARNWVPSAWRSARISS